MNEAMAKTENGRNEKWKRGRLPVFVCLFCQYSVRGLKLCLPILPDILYEVWLKRNGTDVRDCTMS